MEKVETRTLHVEPSELQRKAAECGKCYTILFVPILSGTPGCDPLHSTMIAPVGVLNPRKKPRQGGHNSRP